MQTIYYSPEQGQLKQASRIVHNALIYMVNPTSQEIAQTAKDLKIPAKFFRDVLDVNERPRITREQEALLMILNMPTKTKHNVLEALPYQTIPFGIIHVKDHMVVVAKEEVPMFASLIKGMYGDFDTHMKTRMTLFLFEGVAIAYEQTLMTITQQVGRLQHKLKKAYRNNELFGLINLNKSLVYFSTSLGAMQIVFERLLNGRDIKLYDEDARMLQSALLDIKQAKAVTELRRESLSNLMDAYAVVIHNNLNSILKILTTLTIVLVIPTMMGSIFSMNVALPYETEWISTIVVGILMVLIVAVLMALFKKKRFLTI